VKKPMMKHIFLLSYITLPCIGFLSATIFADSTPSSDTRSTTKPSIAESSSASGSNNSFGGHVQINTQIGGVYGENPQKTDVKNVGGFGQFEVGYEFFTKHPYLSYVSPYLGLGIRASGMFSGSANTNQPTNPTQISSATIEAGAYGYVVPVGIYGLNIGPSFLKLKLFGEKNIGGMWYSASATKQLIGNGTSNTVSVDNGFSSYGGGLVIDGGFVSFGILGGVQNIGLGGVNSPQKFGNIMLGFDF
jgi:hypothetical protein